jgi:tetratricopeptide (TPR) repeat protein
VALVSAQALAESDDAIGRARTHFEAGRALYNLGNYTEAQREFAAGYQLAPRPQFLINLGHCYRKLDNLPRAREMYQRYLAETRADDPLRTQAEQVLAEVEHELAQRTAKLQHP